MTHAAMSLRGEPVDGRRLDVMVSHSPQQSVYFGVRPPSSTRLHSRRARHTVIPWAPPGTILRTPDAMVPIVDRVDVSVGEQVECLHAYPESRLVDELVDICRTNPGWVPAARRPRQWLRAYGQASLDEWRRLEPRWRSARHLFDRETERVGVGVVRGGIDAMLNTLSRRLRFADGTFHFDERLAFPLAGRKLILVPSLMPVHSVLVYPDEPDVMSIAYPLPGAGAGARVREHRDDRLAVVLGEPRAVALRALEVPLGMGSLAARLGVTPAAATRHSDLLEKAGLIRRERRGKAVHASRTEAGDELLDLLG